MFRIIRIIVKWGIRLSIVVGVILFFAVIVTSTMGGKGDIARASLERVIFGTTGLHATVHELNDYRIFPEFKIDFKNLTGNLNRQGDQKMITEPDDNLPDVILGRVYFVQDSLRNLWGGAAISAALFENLILRPGVVGPYSLHLKTGRIMGPVERDAHLSNPPAQFVMTGDYGRRHVTITVPLRAVAAGGQWYYRVDGLSDIVVKVGKKSLAGRLNVHKESWPGTMKEFGKVFKEDSQ